MTPTGRFPGRTCHTPLQVRIGSRRRGDICRTHPQTTDQQQKYESSEVLHHPSTPFCEKHESQFEGARLSSGLSNRVKGSPVRTQKSERCFPQEVIKISPAGQALHRHSLSEGPSSHGVLSPEGAHLVPEEAANAPMDLFSSRHNLSHPVPSPSPRRIHGVLIEAENFHGSLWRFWP